MTTFRCLVFLLCICISLLPACVRQKSSAVDTEILRQGQLNAPQRDVNIAPLVYVNVRDNTNRRATSLRSQTEAGLDRMGYTIVHTPSEAGYILQIVVLAAGITSQEKARAVINSGYGSPSVLSGEGGTALVADVLLVQRQVPSSKRPSRVKLKNISRRNAVANSQMRIGLLIHKEVNLEEGLTSFMMETLAKELADALRKADGETTSKDAQRP
ncbi:MAG: conjugal transfer protein TraT [Desulfovibrio sp.]|nr:conjugal transfer protein TraT [Desulfovibrio sp.]